MMIGIQGVGSMSDSEALAKLTEHEKQISGLESCVREHERGIEECKRQIDAIRKLAEPIRAALKKRLGG